VHEQKLAKLRQYITVFPSHLNNIFSEIFQTFTEFNDKFCDFTIANDISQNFSSITLGFREISKYFVDFRVRFWYFQKMTAKLQFLMNRFKISKFRTFRWRKLKKLNITMLMHWQCQFLSSIPHCQGFCSLSC
jgi:hypothetical protein